MLLNATIIPKDMSQFDPQYIVELMPQEIFHTVIITLMNQHKLRLMKLRAHWQQTEQDEI